MFDDEVEHDHLAARLGIHDHGNGDYVPEDAELQGFDQGNLELTIDTSPPRISLQGSGAAVAPMKTTSEISLVCAETSICSLDNALKSEDPTFITAPIQEKKTPAVAPLFP
eukprot:GSA25T00024755001.1